MVGLRTVRWLVTVLCLAAAFGWAYGQIDRDGAVRIDLYQYWGVGQVIRLTDGEVRNPYLASDVFERELARFAARSDDPALREVQSLRSRLELQATPLAYAFFSLLPGSYARAQLVWSLAQLALFGGALALLLRGPVLPSWERAWLGLLLVSMFIPLRTEMHVANYNTLLLFGTALALDAIRRIPDAHGEAAGGSGEATGYGAGALALLGTLTLLKPTVAPIAAVLGGCTLARLGPRRAARPIAVAAIALLLVAAWPMARLGSAAIWLEWLHYFRTGNLDMFDLPWSKGNRSTALFLSKQLGVPLGVATAAVAAALAATLWAALRRAPSIGSAALAALRDPTIAVATGVVALLATSPLAWQHYYVHVLAAALPLLATRAADDRIPPLAALGLGLAALVPGQLLVSPITASVPAFAAALPYALHVGGMLSWIPLWIAVLLAVAASASRDGVAAGG